MPSGAGRGILNPICGHDNWQCGGYIVLSRTELLSIAPQKTGSVVSQNDINRVQIPLTTIDLVTVCGPKEGAVQDYMHMLSRYSYMK